MTPIDVDRRPDDARSPAGAFVMTPAGRVDRYGIALWLIVATIAIAFVRGGPWFDVAGVALAGLTLVFCLTASDARRPVVATARVMTGAAFLLAVALTVFGADDVPVAGIGLIGATLAFATPIPIARRLARQTAISGHTVAGALCLYLLAGLCFAYAYATIDALAGPVFAQLDDADLSDTVYFSFVTLATLGYGDLSPVPQAARLLAIMEAIGGQLYLVTIIAVLVSNLGRSRRNAG